MASIYYLLDDANDIAETILVSIEGKVELDKKRYFAALVIQRKYRGFVVRKKFLRILEAVKILQKSIRGHLTRSHLPKMARMVFEEKCLKEYNRKATKLQATYKGYSTRKKINIAQILDKKKESSDVISELNVFMAKIFKKRAERREFGSDLTYFMDPAADEGTQKMLKAANKSREIAEFLFDKHHLLRTYQKEGVLSLKDSKELSAIEKIIEQLDVSTYMKQVRKLYKETANFEFEHEYMFDHPKARKFEDLYRIKNQRDGPERKPELNLDEFDDFDKPAFNLTTKLGAKSYHRILDGEETYTGPQPFKLRERVKTEDIGPEFNLDVLHTEGDGDKGGEMPYYIDHWKKICCNHNFMYDFMQKNQGNH